MEILLAGQHHKVFLLACEDDAVCEAYSREEVLGNEVLRLCIHRMKTEAAESNMGLLRHDGSVVEDADARCYKGAGFASNQRVVGQEVHATAVPANHNGRKQVEAVHGYCCMGSGASLHSRTDKERNYDENPSKHLHADALVWE